MSSDFHVSVLIIAAHAGSQHSVFIFICTLKERVSCKSDLKENMFKHKVTPVENTPLSN
jgi:hypothetical protein